MQTIELCKWGVKWLKYAINVVVHGNRAEQISKVILGVMDSVDDNPEKYVATTVDVHSSTVHIDGELQATPKIVEKKRVRLVKGKRTSFACALAKRAYIFFGERPMSKANVGVTRRWLERELRGDKFKDLRDVDKAAAIDRATFLSFVPTKEWINTKIITTTKAFDVRCTTTSFGKIGRLSDDSK